MSPSARGITRLGILSRRALEELSTLEGTVRELGAERGAALRLFLASRYAATLVAQREFWLQFAWADQEYRVAVTRLAQFCVDHREGSTRAWKTGPVI